MKNCVSYVAEQLGVDEKDIKIILGAMNESLMITIGVMVADNKMTATGCEVDWDEYYENTQDLMKDKIDWIIDILKDKI